MSTKGAMTMRKFLIALAFLFASSAHAQTVPPLRMYQTATLLPLRYKLNFTGSGVSCVDNSGSARTDCTITGGSSGNFSFSGNSVDLSGAATMTLGGTNTNTLTLKSGAASGGTIASLDTTGAWTTGTLLDMKQNGSTVAKFTITDSAAGFILTDNAGVVHLVLDANGAHLGTATTAVGANYNIVGGLEFTVGGGIEYEMTGHDFFPAADVTSNLGKASKRFDVGYVGSGNASPTCDSTTRGGYKTVFAAGGASDTFQVCMKAAADTYAWRTVFTAP